MSSEQPRTPQCAIVATDLSRPEHAAAFLRLLDHYAQDPMGGGRALDSEVRERLVPALQARAGFFSWLFFCDGEAAGLLNAFEGFSTFAARPLLNIHDLVVHAAWRGRGLGRLLLASAEALARSRGCCKLTLEVLEANARARATYQRFGFASYQLEPAAGRALFLEKKL